MVRPSDFGQGCLNKSEKLNTTSSVATDFIAVELPR